MRVVFLGVCALCLLLLHLFCGERPGALPVSVLIGWSVMTFVCFAPVQVQNFLYGIEIETFFPGFATLSSSRRSTLAGSTFKTKALLNLTLAFVCDLHICQWDARSECWPAPLPSPNERLQMARPRASGSLFTSSPGFFRWVAYFMDYQRP